MRIRARYYVNVRRPKHQPAGLRVLQVLLLAVLIPTALYLGGLTIPVLLTLVPVLTLLRALGLDLAPLAQLLDRAASWLDPTVAEIPEAPTPAEGIRLATVHYGRRPEPLAYRPVELAESLSD